MDDPSRYDARLTVLSPEAFDALLDVLDNPPELSEKAKAAFAAARLWPRRSVSDRSPQGQDAKQLDP